MTKKGLFTLLLWFTVLSGIAQVQDNFTDTNFTQNPTWVGDDSLFQVSSGQLRLKGTIASEAFLATPHTQIDSTTWTFFTRFTLSPSTQNFSRFYLIASSSNLKTALNGYYVQLGGVTGNTDSINLYKQVGSTHTRIVGGRASTVSKTNNLVRIKVFRDHLGNWELYSDTTGGKNYVQEGVGFDNSITTGNYLGWYVKYTSGNNQGFYLDDVGANKIGKDTVAPTIDSVVQVSNNQLMVYFSEAIDTPSATNTDHYLLLPQTRNPISAALTSEQSVLLQFGVTFEANVQHTLQVNNVQDLSGNLLWNGAATFFNQVVLPEAVVISEFFPDPSPAVGLPELEFIELYNNSSLAQNLSGFQLSDGGTPAILPNVILQPDSFVIVCATSAVSAFQGYGNVVGVSNFPSLNNSGDQIILKSKQGDVIHTLSYDLTWYNDIAKIDGGWSIELIQPKELCKGATNFAASQHVNGGTPGQRNSIWRNQVDTIKPKLKTVYATDSLHLNFIFDKSLSTSSAQRARVKVNGSNAQLSLIGKDTIEALLTTALLNKTTYTISIDSIADCIGNSTNLIVSYFYVIAEPAQNYDVLIHEIMSDPDPVVGLVNAEYVELYNRSNRAIQLKNWTLMDGTGSTVLPSFLLLPDSFVVLAASSNAASFAGSVIGLSSFPSLSNDGETLTLYNDKGQVIHTITYSSNWHSDVIRKNGGWSLEMVDAKNPCGVNNWKSSINNLGGTPGKPNSVKAVNTDKTQPSLIRVYASDSSHVQLYFSEAMDSTSFASPNNYLFSSSLQVTAVSGQAPSYQSTVLTIQPVIQRQETYRIQVSGLTDCAGNTSVDASSIAFSLAETLDSGQVIINEVLFNPVSNGVDFVELYNNSDKAIDLKELAIVHLDEQGTIDDSKSISSEGYILMPREYVVLTSNPELVKQQYYCMNPQAMITLSLTSLPDDEGNIALAKNQGELLDVFYYNKNMHLPTLVDQNGVSLERIDPNRSSQDFTNWTSAASSVGYATPTYKNSQYLATERADQVISLQPKTVSPDGDGFQDVMNINYQFTEDGYVGSLTIYDASGRAVKHLFKNHIMGKDGTYTWDGTLDNGTKAPIGMYIFYLDVFSTTGSTKQYKTVGVVAGKL